MYTRINIGSTRTEFDASFVFLGRIGVGQHFWEEHPDLGTGWCRMMKKIILVTPTASSRVLARRALFCPAAPAAQLAVVLKSTEGRIHVRN